MSMLRAETLHTVAAKGDAPGEVRDPRALSVDRIRGRIFVTDYHRDVVNIYRITPPHHFISSFGGHGTGDGEFDRPAGAVCDSEGRLIVCDLRNRLMQIFTSEGRYMTQFADERFAQPRWVNVDHDNNIYVGDLTESGDSSTNQIHVFTPQGQYMRTLPVRGGRFTIHRHRVYRCDGNNKIHVHSLDGTHEHTVTLEGVRWWLGGITASSDGRLLVGDEKNIYIVSPDSGNVTSVYECDGVVYDITFLTDNTLVIVDWLRKSVRTVEVQEENKLLPALSKKEEEFFKVKRSKLHSRVCSKVKDILEDDGAVKKLKDQLYPDFSRPQLSSMNGFQDIWNALEDAGKIKPGEDYKYLKTLLKKIGNKGITANSEIQNLEGLFKRREILFDDSDSDDVLTQPQEGADISSSKRDSEAVERAAPETRACLPVERWWTRRALPLLKTEIPSLYSDSAYKLYIFIFIIWLFYYKPTPSVTESDTSKLVISYVFEICMYLLILILIYYKYRPSSEGGQREQEERNTGERLLPQWMRGALTWLSTDKVQKFFIFIAAVIRFRLALSNMPNHTKIGTLHFFINCVYIVCNSVGIIILLIHNYIKPMSLRGSKTKPDKDDGLLPQ